MRKMEVFFVLQEELPQNIPRFGCELSEHHSIVLKNNNNLLHLQLQRWHFGHQPQLQVCHILAEFFLFLGWSCHNNFLLLGFVFLHRPQCRKTVVITIIEKKKKATAKGKKGKKKKKIRGENLDIIQTLTGCSNWFNNPPKFKGPHSSGREKGGEEKVISYKKKR